MAYAKKKYTRDQLEEMIGELQTQLVELKDDAKKADPDGGTVECEICHGRYTYKNAATHRKSQKHKNEVEHLKTLHRILKSRTLDGRQAN
jgi:hypothetical protein